MKTDMENDQAELNRGSESVQRLVGPDFGPACPHLAKRWKKKGCELRQAAKLVAENDDVRCLMFDADALPISVALLGMIYNVPDAMARDAVIHWLRRPNSVLNESTLAAPPPPNPKTSVSQSNLQSPGRAEKPGSSNTSCH